MSLNLARIEESPLIALRPAVLLPTSVRHLHQVVLFHEASHWLFALIANIFVHTDRLIESVLQ